MMEGIPIVDAPPEGSMLISACARRWKIKKQTVRNYIISGQLKAVRVAGVLSSAVYVVNPPLRLKRKKLGNPAVLAAAAAKKAAAKKAAREEARRNRPPKRVRVVPPVPVRPATIGEALLLLRTGAKVPTALPPPVAPENVATGTDGPLVSIPDGEPVHRTAEDAARHARIYGSAFLGFGEGWGGLGEPITEAALDPETPNHPAVARLRLEPMTPPDAITPTALTDGRGQCKACQTGAGQHSERCHISRRYHPPVLDDLAGPFAATEPSMTGVLSLTCERCGQPISVEGYCSQGCSGPNGSAADDADACAPNCPCMHAPDERQSSQAWMELLERNAERLSPGDINQAPETSEAQKIEPTEPEPQQKPEDWESWQ